MQVDFTYTHLPTSSIQKKNSHIAHFFGKWFSEPDLWGNTLSNKQVTCGDYYASNWQFGVWQICVEDEAWCLLLHIDRFPRTVTRNAFYEPLAFRSSRIPKKSTLPRKRLSENVFYIVAISSTGRHRLETHVASQLQPISTRIRPRVAPLEESACDRMMKTFQKAVHGQVLLSSEAEHRASDLEKCGSWFSSRNDRYPPSLKCIKKSKCIPFTKKWGKKKNGELMRHSLTKRKASNTIGQHFGMMESIEFRYQAEPNRPLAQWRHVVDKLRVCT